MKDSFYMPSLAIILLLFIYLIGLTFFENPIYIWDEAVYANNALEMSHSHNPFVLTLDYQPTLYNTKPPLGIWLMAISIKLFGENEFAVRLPSVIAFIGVLCIALRFSNKQLGSNTVGIFASLVLLGSPALLISHGVRTGDIDSLLLLCTTALLLTSFSFFLNYDSVKTSSKKELFKLTVIVLVGFLVKSTTIFLLMPGLAICLLISGKCKTILRQKWLYLLSLILLVLIFSYYLLMHYLYPGHNRQVIFSEYKRIYADIMPWHKHPAGWYLNNLIRTRFVPFIYFLLPAALFGFFSINKNIRRITLFSAINIGVFFLIISLVPDKLEWYDLPMYPLFALMIGIGTYEMINRFLLLAKIFSKKYKIILFWIFLVILILPALELHKRILANDIMHEFEKEAYCVKRIKKKFPEIRNITVLMEVENPLHRLSLDFYRKVYQKRLRIRVVNFVSELQKGDTVLYSQKTKVDSLKFNFEKIDTLRKLKHGILVVLN